MENEPSAKSLARQLEHTLYQLDSLSVLPAAATKLLRGLFEMSLSPDELNNIAESDPAVAVTLFSLLHRRGIRPKQGRISIRTAIQQLSLRQIRDSLFSEKIYLPAGNDPARLELRKNLVAFAAAVGYCCREITEQGSADIEPELAFAAGLLHNIGNLALDEAMPRSFQRLIYQAKTRQLSITAVQQQNLGLDYTILGKRLAQRWHLPEPVLMAIWLHQSDTETITKTIPQAKIAQVVRLGYLISRRAEIGTSASFDRVELPDELLKSLAITAAKAEQIGDRVVQVINQKSQYFGTDINTDVTQYCDALQFAAGKLASEGSKLSQQIEQSHTKSSHFDFTSELLTTFEPAVEPMEIAQRFACHFRKFYQTGKVCLYLLDPQEAGIAEAVITEDNNNIRTARLSIPAEASAVPDSIANNFAVVDAEQNCNWIFEKLNVDFDTARTKVAPLIAEGSALGAILFEFSYPVQTTRLKEMFEATFFFAAVLLDMAMYRQKQQQLAEALARLVSKPAGPQSPAQDTRQLVLSALAEMAAGAAHELNNPLAVVSGRSQLLSESETDSAKKQTLQQIKTNCRELADIVNDLMSYAEPAPPRKTHVRLDQLLEEATQLTSLKTGLDNIDARTDFPDGGTDIFVDSGQIAPVLANILCNALQSYQEQSGPIEITAESEDNSVKLCISDRGCGMDAQTLEKATYPFFSSKPAGRKRGMGLAHAARLIKLNGGDLKIQSKPGEGTTVTVTLPR